MIEKYFKQITLLELMSIAYGIIHNFTYLSQYLMFVAAVIAVVCSVLLFWICFKSKVINKKQKTIGLIVASIPLLIILGGLIFILILSRVLH